MLPLPDGRPVGFEWIGLRNYLDEVETGRCRGSRATSADAVLRYRTRDGSSAALLIEWKYVEGTYSPELGPGNHLRRDRYMRAMRKLQPLMRAESFTFDDLLVEPFYQLLRLGLLAAAMEAERELGADSVRVAWIRPVRNHDLCTQIRCDRLRAIGSTVEDVWRSLLSSPDRFIVIDSAELISRAASRRAQILVDVGPMDPITTAGEPPVGSLLSRCVEQPREPRKGNSDRSPVS
jgi:restriction endonuclease-like protein